jgi:LDH2 family malate/lactate/ureidoglycolate dehydrogenase
MPLRGGVAMPYATVDWKLIESFVRDVFVAYGVPWEDAKIVADVLLDSDRRGIESHGVNRFKPVYLDRIKSGIQKPVTVTALIKETPATAILDGGDGMGQVIARRAMALAIEKAKNLGMGMVAVQNSTHYGIAGYYVNMAAEQGCVGITGTNARPSVAPTFGVENMLGTNPLTFGMPTDEAFPFILDCATSITQRGRLEVYARTGREVPAGMVVGQDGKPMADAAAILAGLSGDTAALAPLGGIGEELGGYKGYGYATVVEVMSAAFTAGPFLKALTGIRDGKQGPFRLGHFFMAIDTEAFVGRKAFEKCAGDIMRALRASTKAPGHDRIYTAGEKEYLIWQERKDTGVPISEAVQKELLAIRDELGLTQYRFPFEQGVVP